MAILQTIEPMGVFGDSYALPPTSIFSLTVTDYSDSVYHDLVVQSDTDAQAYLGSFSGDVTVDTVLPGASRSNRELRAGPIVGSTPWEVMGHTSLDEGWQLFELWARGSDGPELYSLPGPAWSVLAGDFDASSTTDLVTVYESTFYFVRTEANGNNPSFSCYVPFIYKGSVGNLAMGDFDGNARDDVAISTIDNELWLMFSQ